MDRVVANEIIGAELNSYRQLTLEDIRLLVGERVTRRVRGRDGVDYDLTTELREQGDGVTLCTTICNANWGSPHDPLSDSIEILGRRGVRGEKGQSDYES
jgi:hypothetical protein